MKRGDALDELSQGVAQARQSVPRTRHDFHPRVVAAQHRRVVVPRGRVRGHDEDAVGRQALAADRAAVRGLAEGCGEGEDAAFALRARHADRSAHALDELAGDREAVARAAETARDAAVDLGKLLEQQ